MRFAFFEIPNSTWPDDVKDCELCDKIFRSKAEFAGEFLEAVAEAAVDAGEHAAEVAECLIVTDVSDKKWYSAWKAGSLFKTMIGCPMCGMDDECHDNLGIGLLSCFGCILCIICMALAPTIMKMIKK